jgi:hypothetical protein
VKRNGVHPLQAQFLKLRFQAILATLNLMWVTSHWGHWSFNFFSQLRSLTWSLALTCCTLCSPPESPADTRWPDPSITALCDLTDVGQWNNILRAKVIGYLDQGQDGDEVEVTLGAGACGGSGGAASQSIIWVQLFSEREVSLLTFAGHTHFDTPDWPLTPTHSNGPDLPSVTPSQNNICPSPLRTLTSVVSWSGGGSRKLVTKVVFHHRRKLLQQEMTKHWRSKSSRVHRKTHYSLSFTKYSFRVLSVTFTFQLLIVGEFLC